MKTLSETLEKWNGFGILDDHLYLPDEDLPGKPEKRKKTDGFFLIAFAVCMGVYLCFLMYTLYYSDIYRFRGHDRCGNVCSKKNAKYEEWNCTGKDLTLKPSYSDGECTDEQVTPWTLAFGDFKLLAQRIVLVSTIPLALCLILVALFRFASELAVRGILIAGWFLGIVITIGDWVMFVVWILLVFVLAFSVDKIRLVTIQLREAARAAFDVKKLFFIPIVTLMVLLTISAIHVAVTLYIMNAGRLTQAAPSVFRYLPDNYMLATWFLSPIMFIWTVHFILGIRDAVVSGAVAKWYSTRNRDDANDDAVSIGLLATFSNHLGTIALGSLLNVTMLGPRIVLKCLAQVTALKVIVDCCISYLDGFFSNDLYIMTAIHGTSFVQSGKKATRLLKSSTGSSMGVNSFADFVIALAQILVVVLSILFAYFNNMYFDRRLETVYLVVIDSGLAYVIGCATLGTLKVASNAVFFCVVEEASNDREASCPYAANTRELVSASSKEYIRKVQNRPLSDVSRQLVRIKVFFTIFACCVSYVSLRLAFK